MTTLSRGQRFTLIAFAIYATLSALRSCMMIGIAIGFYRPSNNYMFILICFIHIIALSCTIIAMCHRILANYIGFMGDGIFAISASARILYLILYIKYMTESVQYTWVDMDAALLMSDTPLFLAMAMFAMRWNEGYRATRDRQRFRVSSVAIVVATCMMALQSIGSIFGKQIAPFTEYMANNYDKYTILESATMLLPCLIVCVSTCICIYHNNEKKDGPACNRCGYSMIGNVNGICPECGSPKQNLDRNC